MTDGLLQELSVFTVCIAGLQGTGCSQTAMFSSVPRMSFERRVLSVGGGAADSAQSAVAWTALSFAPVLTFDVLFERTQMLHCCNAIKSSRTEM